MDYTFALDELDTRTRSEAGVRFPVMRIDRDEPMINQVTKEQLWIELYGPDSEAYQRVQSEIVRKRVKDAAEAAASPQVDTYNDEQAKEDRYATLVAVTKGWNIPLSNGDVAPCTPEVRRVMYERYPAIYDQMQARLMRRVNFMLASPKGSLPLGDTTSP